MPQFLVRVYASGNGFRVVVDGMTELDVGRGADVVPAARSAILERLGAYIPHRPIPPPDPAAVRTIGFDLTLSPTEATPPGPHRLFSARPSSRSGECGPRSRRSSVPKER